MLIPDNIHPEETVYYNGSVVLRVIKQLRTKPVLSLYQAVQSERPMSPAMFALCLDWLYLINLVRLGVEGDVELCT